MQVKYVCSGPVVAIVLEGTKSVEGSRNEYGDMFYNGSNPDDMWSKPFPTSWN